MTSASPLSSPASVATRLALGSSPRTSLRPIPIPGRGILARGGGVAAGRGGAAAGARRARGSSGAPRRCTIPSPQRGATPECLRDRVPVRGSTDPGHVGPLDERPDALRPLPRVRPPPSPADGARAGPAGLHRHGPDDRRGDRERAVRPPGAARGPAPPRARGVPPPTAGPGGGPPPGPPPPPRSLSLAAPPPHVRTSSRRSAAP